MNDTPTLRRLESIDSAAERHGVATKTIRRRIADGTIPALPARPAAAARRPQRGRRRPAVTAANDPPRGCIVTCEEAASQDRPDAAHTDTTTVLPSTYRLLRDALSRGDESVAAVLRWLLDGRDERRRRSERSRREQLFDPDTVARLEMDDRRRDAARRLPRLCDDAHGEHRLACVDPLGGDR